MINSKRLWDNLISLGEIGKQENAGITRLGFTDEEREALRFVRILMEKAGLEVREDAVGNIIGRKEGTNPDAPAVLIGSHIDSVHNGGIFDGNLGILAGIEVLQTMNEQNISTKHPLEVYAFRDEEGCRFGFSSFGSRSAAGIVRQENFDYKDKDGLTIREVLKNNGLNPEEYKQAARKPEEIKAYLELHPEQGKVLECKNLSVGIVTGIASSLRLKVTIIGSTDHAGATPMELRKDSLTAAAEIILIIEKEASNTEDAVGTVGRIEAFPGGVNIIPGKVEFTIDLRDLSAEVGKELEDRIMKQAIEVCKKRGVEIEFEELQRVPPAPCDPEIISMMEKGCQGIDIPVFKLPSGAGHDAMQIINICPIGMIFVRSKDGISHHPDEWSSYEDCSKGAELLYETVLKLAIKEKVNNLAAL